jgi:hypothetical protein
LFKLPKEIAHRAAYWHTLDKRIDRGAKPSTGRTHGTDVQMLVTPKFSPILGFAQ